jgi:Flp pilus assembly protein TadG
MSYVRCLARDSRGAAVVETAFALPVFIVMIWAFVQLAQVYRALAGIQEALGEGARYATLCVNPTATGCSAPTASQIKSKVESEVYGIGPGTFTVPVPTNGTSGTAKYYDLTVNYTQPTDLLLLPGPTIAVRRSKRVWTAAGT